MWQFIDPVRAIEALSSLVYNAAAKDTRINDAVKVNRVLDPCFGRVAPDDPNALSLGGRYTLSRWPEASSWDFVAVGRGRDFAGRDHDAGYWREFLQALERVDPDIPVNIEHEDQELDQLEGLRFAARTCWRPSASGRKQGEGKHTDWSVLTTKPPSSIWKRSPMTFPLGRRNIGRVPVATPSWR